MVVMSINCAETRWRGFRMRLCLRADIAFHQMKLYEVWELLNLRNVHFNRRRELGFALLTVPRCRSLSSSSVIVLSADMWLAFSKCIRQLIWYIKLTHSTPVDFWSFWWYYECSFYFKCQENCKFAKIGEISLFGKQIPPDVTAFRDVGSCMAALLGKWVVQWMCEFKM